MDVRYLNYILEIARQKSITKAASVLYVSQSSLSQYLSKLEQELGTPLFVRKKHDLDLTPAGHLYVEAAKSVIQIQGSSIGASQAFPRPARSASAYPPSGDSTWSPTWSCR